MSLTTLRKNFNKELTGLIKQAKKEGKDSVKKRVRKATAKRKTKK